MQLADAIRDLRNIAAMSQKTHVTIPRDMLIAITDALPRNANASRWRSARRGIRRCLMNVALS